MFLHFLYTARVETIQKLFAIHTCFCFCIMEFRKQKNLFWASATFYCLLFPCFTQKKKKIPIMNKVTGLI